MRTLVITAHSTDYAPFAEGADDREIVGTHEESDTWDPQDDESPVTFAARVLNGHGVSGSNNEPWRAGSRLIGDDYEHPYTGVLTEISLELTGFTPEEEERIIREVLPRVRVA